MLRLFMHLLFVGPSKRSMRGGSVSLWRYSPVRPRSSMGRRIMGTRLFGRGAQRETFGVQLHIDVIHEKNAEGTAVEVNVTSTGGYSGPGTFSFSIGGGLIERWVIR